MKRSLSVFLSLVVLFSAAPTLASRKSSSYSDTLSGLESLSPKKSGLSKDYDGLKHAETLLKSGNATDAMKSALKVSDGILSLWRNVVLAEIYLSQNEPRQVLALLKSKPNAPRPELSFGETAYKDLYVRFMTARFQALKALGEDYAHELGELYSQLYDGGSATAFLNEAAVVLSTRQKVALLHRFHFSYQYKKIPGIVSTSEIRTSTLPKAEKCQALYELGNGLRYNSGQAENSMTAFSELTEMGCSDDLTAKGLYWLGHLASSSKKESLTVAALTRLSKTYPAHRLADDAVYLLRRYYEKTGNSHEAKKYEEKLLGLAKGDMRNQYIFDKAYPHYKKGDYKQAAKILAQITTGEPSADETYSKALYWLGRSLEKTKSKDNAAKSRATYKRVVAEFPFSFYAILAASRLGTSVKVPALPTLGGLPPENGADYFALIDSFNRIGRHDEASVVLDFAIQKNPDWEESHEEFMAKTYIECHNYRKALDMAALHFDSGVYGPTSPTSDPLFAAFYPRAYAKQTSFGYASTDLPKGAIEGIMREESLFQKDVRSWVGATGLMQLMPSTAQLLRKKIQNGSSLTDLTDPQSNIILGSTYLSDMKSYFSGELPLAIMAYNAGPGNVRKWLRGLPASELDEFIEDIPFSETRGYVKRVMRSMQVYGALYQEPFFKKPFFNFNVKVAMRN